MKKRFFLALLPVLLLLCMWHVTALAATEVASGDCGQQGSAVHWSLDSNGLLSITGRGYMCSMASPESQPWAAYRDQIKKVELCSGVNSIEKYAFYNCRNLKEAVISGTVHSIESYAFYGSGVESIRFVGDGLNKLGYESLKGCTHLRMLELPDSLGAFFQGGVLSGCTALETVRLPAALSEISTRLFYGCTSLKSITIPASVHRIGRQAFLNCGRELEVRFEHNAPELPSDVFYGTVVQAYYPLGNNSWDEVITQTFDGTVQWIGYTPAQNLVSISACTVSLTQQHFTYDGTAKTPKASVYYNGNVLTEGVDYRIEYKNNILSGTATAIIWGIESYQGKTELPFSIEVSTAASGEIETTTGNKATWQLTEDGMLIITPVSASFGLASGVYAYDSNNQVLPVFPWSEMKDSITSVVLREGVSQVADRAFTGYINLKTVQLPSTIIGISQNVFEGCSSLDTIIIPKENRLGFIDSKAFKDCVSLQSLSFSKRLTSFDVSAINGCGNLQEITFEGVPPFEKINGFLKIRYPAQLASVWQRVISASAIIEWIPYDDGSDMLSGQCGDSLTWSLDPESGILSVSGTGDMYSYDTGNNAAPWFPYRSLVQHIEIENGVTSICAYAFSGCNATSMSLPTTLVSVGMRAFEGTDLESVIIPNSVSVIPYMLFGYCYNLREISLPETIERIDTFAYVCCNNLVEINIPDNVKSIGEGAFASCTSLKHISLGKGLTRLSPSVFSDDTNLELEIPENIRYIASESLAGVSKVTFLGNASYIHKSAFRHSSDYGFYDHYQTTAYYPSGDDSWNDVVTAEYDNNSVVWIPYTPDSFDIGLCEITLDNTSFIYDGTPKTPAVAVKLGGAALTLNTDYTVRYEDNIHAGTGKAIITGVGNYSGSASKEFTIAKAKPTLTFSSLSVQKGVGDADFANNLTFITDGTITFTSSDASVATVNSSLGWVHITGKGSTTITAAASAGMDYLAGSASYYLTVSESQQTTTILEDLSYCFSNSRYAFGYDTGYRIPLERYQAFYSDTQAKYLYSKSGTWGGSCYGMSITASMLYNSDNGFYPSDYGRSRIQELTVSDSHRSLDMNVREMIEYGQISWYANSGLYYPSLNELCNAVQQGAASGAPAVIAVYGPEGGHALVGYKIEKMDAQTSRLYVYDCNYPLKERYITLYTDSSGNYTGWYYHLNNVWNWGSNYSGCKILYVPYSMYHSVWTSGRGINDTTNILCVSSDNYDILDYAGNTVAQMRDGQFITFREDIYSFRGPDMSFDNELIYLPSDVYEIINTESSDAIQVDMVNKYHSASIDTTADSLLVAVVDSDDTNMVYINAEQGDAYNVTLYSENTGYEKVEFSGVSDGAKVTLGTVGGDLYMANCTGVTMLINDMMVTSASEEFQRNIAQYPMRLEYTQCVADGAPKMPDVIVGEDYSLKHGVDYAVEYTSNIQPGTATVKVYGIGSYSGISTLNFTILESAVDVCTSGHQWNTGNVEVKPTFDSNGVTIYTCEVCGTKREESVPGLSYSLVEHTVSTISISLKNLTTATLTGNLCLAGYDDKGGMVAMSMTPVSIAGGEQVTATLTLSAAGDAAVFKAFMLDSSSFAPIGQILVIE